MSTQFDIALRKHGYTLGRFLGKGSTADCFEVYSSTFQNRNFACKIIDIFPPERKESIIKVFTDEVKLLSELDHPNIIRCYDFFQEHTSLYIILEYCEYGTINHLLCSQPDLVRANYLQYAIEIVDALLNCHTHNVAHLDIKPQNIFVNKYNKTKLSDFGFSKVVKPGDMITKRIGSKFFMAPEIGNGPYDPFKADIYSLGITLLFLADPYFYKQCTFGHFIDDTIHIAQNLGEFGLIIIDCLRKDPRLRPTIYDVFNRLSSLRIDETKKKVIHNPLIKLKDLSPILPVKSQKSIVHFKPITRQPSRRLTHSHIQLQSCSLRIPEITKITV